MKILIKYPTRNRPQKFLETLKTLNSLSADLSNIHLLVSYDTDDHTMTNEVIEQAKKYFHNGEYIAGLSANKIQACNRDLNRTKFIWDILVLMSDDMVCQVRNWDNLLREEMKKYYPDKDGVLWHNDGYTGSKLNTMCILGKKYYNRFNYIYHPEYASLWCDNEFMEVANILKKQTYLDKVIFKHEHPANNNGKVDNLLRHNETFFHKDKETYLKRKSNNFGL